MALLKSLFGGLLGQQVEVPDAPKESDASIQEAKRKQRVALLNSTGRQSTQLSGGLGVTGDAPVQRKQLLGS